MEAIFNILLWLANIPFGWRFFLLVILGLRAAARWALGQFYGITVTTGIVFFPERRALDNYDTLEKILKDSESVEAFSVIGVKLTNNISNFERYITKLLLPDPRSSSLLNLEATTDREGNFGPFIRTSTQSAIKKNVPVKWYPEFVGYSLIIVDRHKENGWVHVEFVLPHSEHLDRPSIRIYRNKQPKAFEHFVKSFDDMWNSDIAVKPNLNED